MEIFTSDDLYNVDKYPVTSNIKKRYKQTEEGQATMCEIMEKIAKEEREEERERMGNLILILTQNNRTEDLIRVASDSEYRKLLLDELVPEDDA